ncbi:MAG TPA: hypothetical protein VF832_09470 [Longimicrobiales bacterium]
MRSQVLAVAGMVVAAVLGGCARDVTDPANVSVAGVYHLSRVNGATLPFLIQDDGTSRVDVTESVLTLNKDHTWSQATLYRLTAPGDISTDSQTSYGTYSAINGAVELTNAGGAAAHGAVAGTLLTLLDGGFSLVYRR